LGNEQYLAEFLYPEKFKLHEGGKCENLQALILVSDWGTHETNASAA